MLNVVLLLLVWESGYVTQASPGETLKKSQSGDYQALLSILGEKVPGSVQDKVDVIDLLLHLLAEIDLPTLCDVIANDTSSRQRNATSQFGHWSVLKLHKTDQLPGQVMTGRKQPESEKIFDIISSTERGQGAHTQRSRSRSGNAFTHNKGEKKKAREKVINNQDGDGGEIVQHRKTHDSVRRKEDVRGHDKEEEEKYNKEEKRDHEDKEFHDKEMESDDKTDESFDNENDNNEKEEENYDNEMERDDVEEATLSTGRDESNLQASSRTVASKGRNSFQPGSIIHSLPANTRVIPSRSVIRAGRLRKRVFRPRDWEGKINTDGALPHPRARAQGPVRNIRLNPVDKTKDLKILRGRAMYRVRQGNRRAMAALDEGDASREVVIKSVGVQRPQAQLYSSALVLGDWARRKARPDFISLRNTSSSARHDTAARGKETLRGVNDIVEKNDGSGNAVADMQGGNYEVDTINATPSLEENPSKATSALKHSRTKAPRGPDDGLDDHDSLRDEVSKLRSREPSSFSAGANMVSKPIYVTSKRLLRARGRRGRGKWRRVTKVQRDKKALLRTGKLRRMRMGMRKRMRMRASGFTNLEAIGADMKRYRPLNLNKAADSTEVKTTRDQKAEQRVKEPKDDDSENRANDESKFVTTEKPVTASKIRSVSSQQLSNVENSQTEKEASTHTSVVMAERDLNNKVIDSKETSPVILKANTVYTRSFSTSNPQQLYYKFAHTLEKAHSTISVDDQHQSQADSVASSNSSSTIGIRHADINKDMLTSSRDVGEMEQQEVGQPGPQTSTQNTRRELQAIPSRTRNQAEQDGYGSDKLTPFVEQDAGEVDEIQLHEGDEVGEVQPYEGDDVDEIQPYGGDEVDEVQSYEGDDVDEVQPYEGDDVDEVQSYEGDEVDEVQPYEGDDVDELRAKEEVESIFDEGQENILPGFLSTNIKYTAQSAVSSESDEWPTVLPPFTNKIRITDTDVTNGVSIRSVLAQGTSTNPRATDIPQHHDDMYQTIPFSTTDSPQRRDDLDVTAPLSTNDILQEQGSINKTTPFSTTDRTRRHDDLDQTTAFQYTDSPKGDDEVVVNHEASPPNKHIKDRSREEFEMLEKLEKSEKVDDVLRNYPQPKSLHSALAKLGNQGDVQAPGQALVNDLFTVGGTQDKDNLRDWEPGVVTPYMGNLLEMTNHSQVDNQGLDVRLAKLEDVVRMATISQPIELSSNSSRHPKINFVPSDSSTFFEMTTTDKEVGKRVVSHLSQFQEPERSTSESLVPLVLLSNTSVNVTSDNIAGKNSTSSLGGLVSPTSPTKPLDIEPVQYDTKRTEKQIQKGIMIASESFNDTAFKGMQSSSSGATLSDFGQSINRTDKTAQLETTLSQTKPRENLFDSAVNDYGFEFETTIVPVPGASGWNEALEEKHSLLQGRPDQNGYSPSFRMSSPSVTAESSRDTLQQNITGPSAQINGSEADVTGPEADVTGPEADVTGPEADVTGTEADVTGSVADITGSVADITEASTADAEVERKYVLLQNIPGSASTTESTPPVIRTTDVLRKSSINSDALMKIVSGVNASPSGLNVTGVSETSGANVTDRSFLSVEENRTHAHNKVSAQNVFTSETQSLGGINGKEYSGRDETPISQVLAAGNDEKHQERKQEEDDLSTLEHTAHSGHHVAATLSGMPSTAIKLPLFHVPDIETDGWRTPWTFLDHSRSRYAEKPVARPYMAHFSELKTKQTVEAPARDDTQDSSAGGRLDPWKAYNIVVGAEKSGHLNSFLKTAPDDFGQSPSSRFGQPKSTRFGQSPSSSFGQSPSSSFGQSPSSSFGQSSSSRFGQSSSSRFEYSPTSRSGQSHRETVPGLVGLTYPVVNYLWNARPWPNHVTSNEFKGLQSVNMAASGETRSPRGQRMREKSVMTLITPELKPRVQAATGMHDQGRDWGSRFSQGYFGRVFDEGNSFLKTTEAFGPHQEPRLQDVGNTDAQTDNNYLKHLPPDLVNTPQILMEDSAEYGIKDPYYYEEMAKTADVFSQNLGQSDATSDFGLENSVYRNLFDGPPTKNALMKDRVREAGGIRPHVLWRESEPAEEVRPTGQWIAPLASVNMEMPAVEDYDCPGLFGYYGDPQDCGSFFVCSWGQAYRLHCPPGTLWDVTREVCDWAVNVMCLNIRAQDPDNTVELSA